MSTVTCMKALWVTGQQRSELPVIAEFWWDLVGFNQGPIQRSDMVILGGGGE